MCDNAAKTIRSIYLKHIARPLRGTKKTVGAGLLANAVDQSTNMSADTPSSRASPLPQVPCFLHCGVQFQNAVTPPSTANECPVVNAAPSLHRYSTALAISSTLPMRPTGCMALANSAFFGSAS
jgi:hypothetical protein